MTESDENQKVLYQDEKVEKKNGETLTTRRKSVMELNPDGSTTIIDSIVSTTVKSEIKLDGNTKVNVSEVDAELDDKKYIEAMRVKNQLAILKDTNQLICMIPLSAAELILKKIGRNLEHDFNIFSFGIYSLEEINEIRKSMIIEQAKEKKNFTKDLDMVLTPIERLKKKGKKLDGTLFKNVQDRLDFIKAEEERKKREEEEKKRKEEEEKRLQMELKKQRKEKAVKKLKEIRNANRLEILTKKFKQYKNNCEEMKLYEQKRKIETGKKVLRLKIKRDGKEEEVEVDNEEETGTKKGKGKNKNKKNKKNKKKEFVGAPDVYGGEVTGMRRDLIRSTKLNS